jgi:hypothetical protein
VGRFVGKNFPTGVLLLLEWSTKPLLYPAYPNHKAMVVRVRKGVARANNVAQNCDIARSRHQVR